MSRSADTLAWLDMRQQDIMDHHGAAFAERELLRAMVGGATATGGVMSAAYRALVATEVPDLTGRANARQYAHEIMFGSDFGCHTITVPAQALPLLEQSIVENEHDTDTLGELLIAAWLIGHESQLVDDYRAIFDAAWAALPRDTFEHYHPILVGGILYALTGD